MNKHDDISQLKERIDKFNKDRDWDKFHTPVNLSKSIAIEAIELLECFQWDDNNYNIENVKEELADVVNYCIQMSMVLDVDLIKIINDKMDKTEKKYPVDKSKGVSTKYNKL
jgi:NTP pyrophosphatase (non-canonical NTP hydrolase)